MIEWVNEEDTCVGLGQQLLDSTTTQAGASLHDNGNGISTGDKILIVSVFLNALALAWQIYRWRKEK